MAKGEVSSIEEYMGKRMNPALNTFRKAAQNQGIPFYYTDPIPDYWPGDESSQGYGVMTEIDLPKKVYYEQLEITPSLEILERTLKNHFVNITTERFTDAPEEVRQRYKKVAEIVWNTFQQNRSKDVTELNSLAQVLERKYWEGQQKLSAHKSAPDFIGVSLSDPAANEIMDTNLLNLYRFDIVRKLIKRIDPTYVLKRAEDVQKIVDKLLEVQNNSV